MTGLSVAVLGERFAASGLLGTDGRLTRAHRVPSPQPEEQPARLACTAPIAATMCDRRAQSDLDDGADQDDHRPPDAPRNLGEATR